MSADFAMNSFYRCCNKDKTRNFTAPTLIKTEAELVAYLAKVTKDQAILYLADNGIESKAGHEAKTAKAAIAHMLYNHPMFVEARADRVVFTEKVAAAKQACSQRASSKADQMYIDDTVSSASPRLALPPVQAVLQATRVAEANAARKLAKEAAAKEAKEAAAKEAEEAEAKEAEEAEAKEAEEAKEAMKLAKEAEAKRMAKRMAKKAEATKFDKEIESLMQASRDAVAKKAKEAKAASSSTSARSAAIDCQIAAAIAEGMMSVKAAAKQKKNKDKVLASDSDSEASDNEEYHDADAAVNVASNVALVQ